jgi:hypothetical protein
MWPWLPDRSRNFGPDREKTSSVSLDATLRTPYLSDHCSGGDPTAAQRVREGSLVAGNRPAFGQECERQVNPERVEASAETFSGFFRSRAFSMQFRVVEHVSDPPSLGDAKSRRVSRKPAPEFGSQTVIDRLPSLLSRSNRWRDPERDRAGRRRTWSTIRTTGSLETAGPGELGNWFTNLVRGGV